MASANLEGYRRARLDAFRWRFEQPWVTKVLLALGFAAMTGLTARFELHLPWTPVPVTLQTFWVLLTGVLLGSRYGPLSQAMYAGFGVAGAPWFAGGATGIGVLTGVTGGYLLGFVVAAALVGYLTETALRNRTVGRLLVIMLVGDALILLLGSLWLTVVLGTSLVHGLVLGAAPFVPGDLAKAVVAAGVAAAVLPKTPFGPEAPDPADA